jgi:ADP-ribose pyrophosphatase YjhB (NUDIX family)
MISFKLDNVRFNFRVAGVAINNGEVLLHRSIHEDFWALPGGRCNLWESSKEALKREMKEELGVDIKINRIIYFVENFFQHENVNHHELSLYSLIQFPKVLYYKESFKGKEKNFELIFKWFDINKLQNVELYPTFLRTKLGDIKPYPEHIIHYDNKLIT